MSEPAPVDDGDEVEEHGDGVVLPRDEHNQRLVDHVHPADYQNPKPRERYKLVVIGAGPAGLVTAIAAANLGAKVALVEKHLMGGDCLNVGCVPSKALIRSARAVADVRRAGTFGVNVGGEVEVDFPAIMERMRRLRADMSHHDSVERFSDVGIDVFLGSGRFTGRDSIVVEGEELKFERACVATGARATIPPIPGLADAGYLTNESVFSLTELPRRLAVIGAGPIGCELAQSFARFGSEVTLLDMADHVLAREDADAAAIVQEALAEDGIELALGASITGVAAEGDGKTVTYEVDGATKTVTVDAVLVGAGRAPNVQGLGLEAAGVDFDEREGVRVDDHLRTSNPDVFAAGDVCFRYKFTHTADFMARAVIRNALFPFGNARASALTIPWVTYTDPEVAHVGMYPSDAEARGLEVTSFTQEFAGVDRAILDGETAGFVKVHVQKGSDTILGATIVAPHAGEMISELTVAMKAGMGLGSLANVMHPYPTQADAIRKAGDLYNKTRLTPTVKKVMEWWLQ